MPEGAHDPIPQHDVLPIVGVGNGMVGVVRAHAEDGDVCERNAQEGAVKPCVVQRGESATKEEEEHAGDRVYLQHVTRDEEDGPDMVVLAHNEFEGVHVDCVRVATGGYHLSVVMLVHVRIHAAVVQRPVEGRVEQVIDDEEAGQCEERVPYCHLRVRRARHAVARAVALHGSARLMCRATWGGLPTHLVEAPQHIWADRHELQVMERHEHDGDLAESDELPVPRRELLERFAASWEVFPAGESNGHAMAVELQADLREHPEDDQFDRAPLERMQDAVARSRDEERKHAVPPHIRRHAGT